MGDGELTCMSVFLYESQQYNTKVDVIGKLITDGGRRLVHIIYTGISVTMEFSK